MPLNFEKPAGTKDLLPEKVRKVEKIINSAKEFIGRWGYEEIKTPIIEYYETVGLYSKIQEGKLIKFLEASGKTVILRPDLTTPIARFVSSVYKDVKLPIRIMCQGNVYRNMGSKGIEEINQLDVELIGIKDLEADAEVITLAVKTIANFTQANFKISIGHTKFLKILLEQIDCPEQMQDQLYKCLLNQDYVSYKNLINNLRVSEKYKVYLLEVLKLRGNLVNVLEARTWFNTPEWQNTFQEFVDLWEILSQYNIEDFVSLDFSLVGRQNYYTGLIYNVYCEGNPSPICTGGRYDKLLHSFDRPAPATGFAINIPDLLKVITMERVEKYTQEKIVLKFSNDNRLEAIKKAEELRNQGQIVILSKI